MAGFSGRQMLCVAEGAAHTAAPPIHSSSLSRVEHLSVAAEARPRYYPAGQFRKIGPPVTMIGNGPEVGRPTLSINFRSEARCNPAMRPYRHQRRVVIRDHILVFDVEELLSDTVCCAQARKICGVVNLAQFSDVTVSSGRPDAEAEIS